MRMAHRCGARMARGWLAAVLVAAGFVAQSVPAVRAQNFTATTVAELVSDLQAAAQTPGVTTITLVAGRTYTASAPHNGDPAQGSANAFPVIPNGTDVTIVGNGAILERSIAAGTPAFRLFGIATGGTLRLNDLTLRNGLIRGAHGANGSPAHNGGGGGDGNGGAITNDGTLIVRGSTFVANAAVGGAGGDGGNATGIFQSGDGGPGGDGNGGAIYINAGGTIFLTNSTFAQNTATGGDGGNGGNGGTGGTLGNAAPAGIGSGGALFSQHAVTGTNLTVAANSSAGGTPGQGGGAPISPPSVGGGIATQGSTAIVTLTNTIIANNSAPTNPDCANSSGGAVGDGGSNLEYPAGDCAFTTNAQTGDPLFTSAAPQPHGGPSPTLAIPFGSPAVAHGNASVCAATTGPAPVNHVDQRGLPRPAACAIGAFDPEPAPTITAISPSSGSASGGYPVSISGTGFLPGVVVTFDTTTAALTTQSATAITVTAPAHAPGTATVRITNPDGQSLTRDFTFGTVAPLPTLRSGGTPAGAPTGLPAKRRSGTPGAIPSPPTPRP